MRSEVQVQAPAQTEITLRPKHDIQYSLKRLCQFQSKVMFGSIYPYLGVLPRYLLKQSIKM